VKTPCDRPFSDCFPRVQRYNRKVSRKPYGLASLFLCLHACSNAPQSKEAVRQAVVDHLSKRSDMVLSAMEIDVASVAFRKDEADAIVSFRPKGGSGGGGMQMSYTLERKGNSWAVRAKKETGGSPHSTSPAPEASALPPGHPPMTGNAPASPEGQKNK
jgi:hypothetical protein